MFRYFVKASCRLASVDLVAPRRGIVLSSRFAQSATASVKSFGSSVQDSWPDEIKSFLEKEKITSPTPIQEKTLPVALENKDLVGIARTGSGKTLAFVIPAIMRILKERETGQIYKRPSCLVLAPTRELATQIHQVFDKFASMNINSIVLVGGASRAAQIRSLSFKNFDVYIATPGRLQDLIDSNEVDLSGVKYLVLDEADRMLDMGFEPQIRKVIQSLPKDRQTLMYSATWPVEIRELANDFLTDYSYVAVDGQKLKANPNITQLVEVCEPRDKINKLLKYFEDTKSTDEKPRRLIFVNTKRRCDQLILILMRNRIKAVSMHGDRTQRQRDDALRLFKSRLCDVMIATDVAARGLDIDDITHVINFDVPNTIEDYIHRIGRTARVEKKGVALTYFTRNDVPMAKKVLKLLEQTKQTVPNELRRLAGTDYDLFDD